MKTAIVYNAVVLIFIMDVTHIYTQDATPLVDDIFKGGKGVFYMFGLHKDIQAEKIKCVSTTRLNCHCDGNISSCPAVALKTVMSQEQHIQYYDDDFFSTPRFHAYRQKEARADRPEIQEGIEACPKCGDTKVIMEDIIGRGDEDIRRKIVVCLECTRRESKKAE